MEKQKANLQAASRETDDIETDVSAPVQQHSKDASSVAKG